MAILSNDEIHAIVFNTFGMRRFLQDSPIRPDVWERYLTLAARGDGDSEVSLILTPKQKRSEEGLPAGRATELAMALVDRLGRKWINRSAEGGISEQDREQAQLKAQQEYRIAATSRHVVIDVTYGGLIRDLLPLTAWWNAQPSSLTDPVRLGETLIRLKDEGKPIRRALLDLNHTEFFRFVALTALTKYTLQWRKEHKAEKRDEAFNKIIRALAPQVVTIDDEGDTSEDPDDVYLRRRAVTRDTAIEDLVPLWDCYMAIAKEIASSRAVSQIEPKVEQRPRRREFGRDGAALWSDTAIWAIQRNRRASRQALPNYPLPPWMEARVGVELSRDTVKADAATRLFSISTGNLVWAVVDTGIDALHPAFCTKSETGQPLVDTAGEPVLDWEGQALRKIGATKASKAADPAAAESDPSAGDVALARELAAWETDYPELLKDSTCWASRAGKRLIRREGDWLVAYDRVPNEPDYARTAFLRSRVTATLDFTALRKIVNGSLTTDALMARVPWGQLRTPEAARKQYLNKTIDAIRRHNISGREIDWSLIEPLIRLDPYAAKSRPADPHGTHVAGVLAADLPCGLPDDPRPFFGVCPDIQLYDLRVFSDDETDGGGDEFTILAALDYISWVNRDPERPGIHGVNLSLAIRHIVDAHACGGTPVCDAANRMVWAGTVVVAAAGNFGFDQRYMKASLGVGYRGMSIADPGNAEHVITVGATHRNQPHNYGVSYFSSRGPTGDGRSKPDLVAPGEKIRSTIPGQQMLVMDGTSMAAPHVSGVCALLMARHTELIGEPERIKSILMNTATDLGREHYFQGKGLVDALRALQSV